MSKPSQGASALPVIRLTLARPFEQAAVAHGANLEALLSPLGLAIGAFDDEELFVPAPLLYRVVETLASATGRPHIGVELGEQLDPFAWAPLQSAAQNAHSVGDLLLQFSLDAYREATSVVFRLETEGARSTFSERRKVRPPIEPRQNDAFGAAYILSILRQAVGEHWSGKDVIVRVSDPDVFPQGYMNVRLARSGFDGFSVGFPCQWLLLPPNLNASAGHTFSQSATSAPRDQIEALRIVLRSQLDDPNLTVERVAALCGTSARTLTRRLAAQRSSVKDELSALRQQRAESLLTDSAISIAEVGRLVGYPDPSAFARTFKRWTGITPRAFRSRESGTTNRANSRP